MTTQAQTDFFGRGWGFPPAFDKDKGEVFMLEREADIRSSLEILLTTSLGERIMAPEYGCNMDELLFENLNTTTQAIITDMVKTAILYHEPRIDAEKITLDTLNATEGVVLVEVAFRIRSTNTRYNYVFPFYLKQGTDLKFQASLTQLPERS